LRPSESDNFCVLDEMEFAQLTGSITV